MVPKPESSFYGQVWTHVEAKVKNMQKQNPAGKTAVQWGQVCAKVKTELETVQESRNVPFNLAQLADPGQAAIPEDVLEIAKVVKSGKFYFWDQTANCPKAPKVWPRGRNVPIVAFSKELKGPFQHYGHCSVVAGFFWAYAQSLQNAAWKDQVAGFENLCVNALADYKLVNSPAEVNILAFNAVEENEESRENDGFTGARKALLVTFGVKNVMKEKRGQKWNYQEVHIWLKANIKFHDEKAIPSANVCKDLHSLGTEFIKNKRAFAAYQEAETLWGRSTFFDEYSKLVIMCHKSRCAEDLAFMAEWLLAEMKTNFPPPLVPENPSQGKLRECGGPLSIAQAVRDALTCLLRKDVPPTWAPFGDLVARLAQPSRFLEMFPPGGQTPETTVKLFAACPSSLKQAANIMKGILDASKSNPWRERAKGYMYASKTWRVPEDKLLEMFDAFAEDWASFKEARDIEAGRDPAKKKTEPQADDEQKHKAKDGEAASKTAGEPEGVATDKKEEVLEQARQKARGVYTDPGVVILTPEKWDSSALTAMMKAQLVFADQGAFCGFFFAQSDREPRTHPKQNKCLREAPLSKARLASFCHAINDIMVECRDAVVIGVGKAPGNEHIVEEVVAEMQWEHKTIDAVVNRKAYDDFVISGSPTKRRRVHRGLGTTKYKSTYWICWKASKETRGRLPIKSGLREFVDKGSPIGSDIMWECPQVALDEIYAVSVIKKNDALGEGGLETKQEATLQDHKDLTSPPPDFRSDSSCSYSTSSFSALLTLHQSDPGWGGAAVGGEGGQEGVVGVLISRMGHWAPLWLMLCIRTRFFDAFGELIT